MIMGIYSVRFLSNKDLVGVGIAVIDGTTLHGGGFDYLYKGDLPRRGQQYGYCHC